MAVLELLTIPISHYCEKARWALDRASVRYRETRHLQVFHYLSSLARARTVFVPVLFTPEGTIKDSTRILSYVDQLTPEGQRLFPADPRQRREVEALEDELDEGLGVEARRWLYGMAFAVFTRREAVAIAGQGVPAWQRLLMTASYPLARWFLRRRLDVTAATVAEAADRVKRTFAMIENRLADGRRYLTGERFTAADLTFAALAAPVLMPPQYGIRLPQPDELAPALRDPILRFRNTVAGRFALRLFAEDRSLPASAVGDPVGITASP